MQSTGLFPAVSLRTDEDVELAWLFDGKGAVGLSQAQMLRSPELVEREQ